MLGAASSTAAEGDVAMTERRYKRPPSCSPRRPTMFRLDIASEQGGYLARQADALYQQGDERGDNDALRTA